jgi:serine/threonine protein kinase
VLELKLIDFGFACKFDDLKGMNLVLGSPLYMAPELIRK